MSTSVQMPRLGESVAEGTIGSWLKNEGDWVERDESLAEIITDKINAELPSPVAGRLSKTLVKVDETVPVGADIAVIEENADVTASQQAEPAPGPDAAPVENPDRAPTMVMENTSTYDGNSSMAATQATGAHVEERQRISPLARRLAREHDIDLNAIAGTGTGGRVRKEDILAYVEQRQEAPAPVEAQVMEPSTPSYEPAYRPAPASAGSQFSAPPSPVPTTVEEGIEVITPSRMRLAIAEHMVRSKRTSPHATTVVEVDMTNIARWLEKNKD